ncbi:CLUMA_CG017746, isoform A [Clunio marinus]|uniref:CLUMA_CG017746, isoform A n=1 Tax=Clunio marinus TaxID=568069 RepID=A0A1J1IYA2_9DIPT|nr:CLUMA_CG017746, isoform A [Clunio marinus]
MLLTTFFVLNQTGNERNFKVFTSAFCGSFNSEEEIICGGNENETEQWNEWSTLMLGDLQRLPNELKLLILFKTSLPAACLALTLDSKLHHFQNLFENVPDIGLKDGEICKTAACSLPAACAWVKVNNYCGVRSELQIPPAKWTLKFKRQTEGVGYDMFMIIVDNILNGIENNFQAIRVLSDIGKSR